MKQIIAFCSKFTPQRYNFVVFNICLFRRINVIISTEVRVYFNIHHRQHQPVIDQLVNIFYVGNYHHFFHTYNFVRIYA